MEVMELEFKKNWKIKVTFQIWITHERVFGFFISSVQKENMINTIQGRRESGEL